MDKLSAFGTGLGTVPKTRRAANKVTTRTRLKKQFISSQAFHRTLGERVQEPTAGEQFKPQIL
jgi:hypothetical protein